MSFNKFVDNCGTWGLLPNNDKAKGFYSNMKVLSPMSGISGFSKMLGTLFMKVPDFSEVNSLEKLKSQDKDTRIMTVIACHEVFHYLHYLIDKDSFVARSAKKVDSYDNEEELLTIAGEKGKLELPGSIQVTCQPKLFNENSLCKILNLTLRSGHHGKLVDNTSGDTVDLSAMPKSVTTLAELWGPGSDEE